MYKVFKDKGKTFKCNIDISGASLNDCSARLLLETKDGTFLYKGSVNRDGVCEVDIPKIKIIEEGIEGKIKLEVIVENTIFNPWESDFIVSVSKKVNVKVDDDDKQDSIKESKTDDNRMKVSVIMDEDEDDEDIKINNPYDVLLENSIEDDYVDDIDEQDDIEEDINKDISLDKNNEESVFSFDSFMKKR